MKIKALLYCTKLKPYLTRNESDKYWYTMKQFELDTFKNVNTFNGKIVAECDFEVEKIKGYGLDDYYATNGDWQIIENGLGDEDINNCLKGKDGYAIHIKNLHIFNNPRELNFYSSKFDHFKKIKKASKNMMRVWEDKENPRILISIKPERMCKILNKEKDVEVRRIVLKEMIRSR